MGQMGHPAGRSRRRRWFMALMAVALASVSNLWPGAGQAMVHVPGGEGFLPEGRILAEDAGFMGIDPYSNLPEGAKPQVGWEEALARLQAGFVVPRGMPQVGLEVGEEGELYWRLIWEPSGGSNLNWDPVSAVVDASTGRVREFDHLPYLTLPPPPDASRLDPGVARSRAAALVQESFPELWPVLVPWDEGDETLWESDVHNYSFSWVQSVAGVPYPDNRIEVGVHPVTGQVTYLNRVWVEPGDIEQGVATPALEPEVALERIRELGADLVYVPFWPGGQSESQSPTWRLVYLLTYDLLGVEAGTGHPVGWALEPLYPRPTEWQPLGENPAGGAPSRLLTPAAAEIWLREALGLPEGTPGEHRRLAWAPEQVYEFTFQAPAQDAAGYGGQVQVTMDLATGLVQHASQYLDGGYGDVGWETDEWGAVEEPSGYPATGPAADPTAAVAPTAPAAPEPAQHVEAAASDLVRRLYPSLLPQLGSPAMVRSTDAEGGVTLLYPRIWHQIPVETDGVWVDIGPGGNWSQIRLTWTEGSPGDPQEPQVTRAEALERILAHWEPALTWQTENRYDLFLAEHPDLELGLGEERPRLLLVYTLRPRPGSESATRMVDAVTGDLVNEDSGELGTRRRMREELSEQPGGVELLFMLDSGALAGRDEDLDPERHLNRGEALRFLHAVADWPLWLYDQMVVPYTDIGPKHPLRLHVAAALDYGVLLPAGESPRFEPEAPVSRAEYALLLARFLDLGPLASSALEVGVPFQDLDGIPREQRNAISFLAALGILEPGNRFRPEEPITLAEAAVLTVNLGRFAGRP